MLDKYCVEGEGIYEHSKRKSKALTNLDAKPGQYYIARMKAHTVTMQISYSSSPISSRYDAGRVLVVDGRHATGAGRISHGEKRAICIMTSISTTATQLSTAQMLFALWPSDSLDGPLCQNLVQKWQDQLSIPFSWTQHIRKTKLYIIATQQQEFCSGNFKTNLSSKGCVLMVLHHLVNIAHSPVLPNLQKTSPILLFQGHTYPPQPPSQASHSGVSLPRSRLFHNKYAALIAHKAKQWRTQHTKFTCILCQWWECYTELKENITLLKETLQIQGRDKKTVETMLHRGQLERVAYPWIVATELERIVEVATEALLFSSID